MIKVKLEGLETAIRNLHSWEKEKIRLVANQYDRSALAIEKNAKQKVPVDVGRLRSDIQKQVTKSDHNRVVNAEVFNTVKYAPFVEFGTGDGATQIPAEQQEYASQFKGKTGRVRNYRARPYLFPAFEQERPILIQKLTEILR
jgi:HK97 gp10 family phage protein